MEPGPWAAGHDGGRVVFEGVPADLVAAAQTLTARHLADHVGSAARGTRTGRQADVPA